MNTKPASQSKMIMANVLAIIALIINHVMEIFPVTPETEQILVMVLAGLNIVLRFFTSAPITNGFARLTVTRDISAPPVPKSVFASKTLWLNLITLAVTVVNSAMEQQLFPPAWSPYLIFAVAVLNALGRLWISQGVTLKPTKAS